MRLSKYQEVMIMKKFLSLLLTLFLLLAGFPMAFSASAADEPLEGEYMLGEIIIKFYDRSMFPDKEKQYDDEVAKVLGDGLSVVTDNVYVVSSEDFIKNPNATLNRFKNSQFIEYVEPNYILIEDSVPNDPQYKTQSSSLNLLGATNGWAIAKEGGPIIAVIDSGVTQHADLPKLLPGFSAVPTISPNSDSSGHGTGVAGTIGMVGNNGVGGVGINWNANIMPVRTSDASGTHTVANLAKGIMWSADNGAKVINISLTTTSDSVTLRNAIDYAFNKGVAIFAGSGNSATAVGFPARYPNVMGVGGVNTDGKTRHSNSNHGVGLDVMGVYTIHTIAANGNGYASRAGTSFSSPQAAGLASLIWAVNPNLTNAEVYDIIIKGATPLSGGFNTQTGHGLINIEASLKLAQATLSTAVPVTTTPAPVTTTPAPVTTTPAPKTTTPAPTTTKPATTTSAPAPVAVIQPGVNYNFNGQGKAGAVFSHKNIVVDAAGTMNFSVVSIDKNMTIKIEVKNQSTGAVVFSQSFSATGKANFDVVEGKYDATVTVSAANGNSKYDIRFTTPESIVYQIEDNEAPRGIVLFEEEGGASGGIPVYIFIIVVPLTVTAGILIQVKRKSISHKK